MNISCDLCGTIVLKVNIQKHQKTQKCRDQRKAYKLKNNELKSSIKEYEKKNIKLELLLKEYKQKDINNIILINELKTLINNINNTNTCKDNENIILKTKLDIITKERDELKKEWNDFIMNLKIKRFLKLIKIKIYCKSIKNSSME